MFIRLATSNVDIIYWLCFNRWGTFSDPIIYKTRYCTMFRPVFTDQGICYSFNAKHPNLMFKPSKYLTAFEKVFGHLNSFGTDFQPYNITGDQLP